MWPARLASFVPRPRRRVAVLVLEGVGIDDLRTALREGHAPVLAGALRELNPIRPTYPAQSIVEQATFMTASNPARHGVFSLLRPDANYRPRLVTARDLQMPTLWDRAAIDGVQSVVVNLAGTAPPRRISGWLVAGLGAADVANACHPRSIAAQLLSDGYRIDVDPEVARGDREPFVQHVLEVAERRVAAMERLIAGRTWGLAVLAFTELDRFGHRWPDHLPLVAEAWFRIVDAFVGRLLERYRGVHLMVLSGHGLTPVSRQLSVRRWLEAEGYLQAGGDAPTPASVALTVDGSLVYLNARRIFPAGRLDQGTIAPLAQEIAGRLAQLRDPETGARAIAAVLHRRDVYDGPYYRVAPHLVCVPAQGYMLVSSRAPEPFGPSVLAAAHRAEDGFVASTRPAAGRSLAEAGTSVLRWLELHADDIETARPG
ncbi:MAG TPA: alkaline phosphatase family protein [candidate division Zixibacteria bacterium]|nr:alkaline phosphatase family protein [candidate division Zixibacteria bacterium]